MSRVVILHSRDPIIDLREPNAAHVFGPFVSYAAALSFDKQGEDDCYKVALDIVGPHQRDMDASHEHGDHHEGWHGSGPTQ